MEQMELWSTSKVALILYESLWIKINLSELVC